MYALLQDLLVVELSNLKMIGLAQDCLQHYLVRVPLSSKSYSMYLTIQGRYIINEEKSAPTSNHPGAETKHSLTLLACLEVLGIACILGLTELNLPDSTPNLY